MNIETAKNFINEKEYDKFRFRFCEIEHLFYAVYIFTNLYNYVIYFCANLTGFKLI